MTGVLTTNILSCAGWKYTDLWLHVYVCSIFSVGVCQFVFIYSSKGSESFRKQTQMATEETKYASAKWLQARWEQTPLWTQNLSD